MKISQDFLDAMLGDPIAGILLKSNMLGDLHNCNFTVFDVNRLCKIRPDLVHIHTLQLHYPRGIIVSELSPMVTLLKVLVLQCSDFSFCDVGQVWKVEQTLFLPR